VLLAGCHSAPQQAPEELRATAGLEPTKGNNTISEETYEPPGPQAVRVIFIAQNLKPGAEHGFHIHEAGDCSSGDGMSAKGHFNPFGKPHGHYQSAERHGGDMPSLKSDASGNAKASFEIDTVTVSPGPASIVGRGLIVHVQPDDYKTQPTGNAGARSACAVINRS
jgi:Cu-Zn family superoxide dismutase